MRRRPRQTSRTVPKPLVIVESPAKARTIAGFLGPDFAVASSVGHIRDLPRNASEVPPEEKGKPWARTGVDPEQDFRPLYIIPKEKRDVVKRLKAAVKDASELYLATDEDREGESIAWHVLQVCVPRNARVPVKRMVFHEITPEAIREALEHTRDIDEALVDAQETRRILDRLYGYEVSPVLWKKVMPGLSAGRVQSVAVRIIVERERERMRFRPAEWWDLGAILARGDRFTAGLVALDGRRLVTGRDFTEQGELKPGVDAIRLDEPTARELAERLRPATFRVSRVEEKPYRRQPAAPFMTSTLQQEAGRKLGFGAQRTMRAAQWLYENGYITYMRTDSTTLSETALAEARRVAAELYGPEYVPERPRRYTKKVKNAQEAHEAIRPAGEHWRTPEQVAAEVGPDEARIYELVWKRTVASQMADAVGRTVSVRIEARPEGGPVAEFAASGTVITFPGFQRVYVEDADDTEDERSAEERRLPALAEGDVVQLVDLEPQRHQTQPPPRYTEASLVKRLEELGVGRPSTYATIISTIQERGYVWKRNGSLVPSFLAFAVVGLLERHFGRLVDYRFTASMEDDLDRIANREEQRVPWLRRFYFGDGQVGLKQLVSEHLGEIDAREVNAIPIGTDEEGNEIVVRVGRYGPYIQRGKDRVPVPEGLAPDELTVAKALELLSAPSGERLLGTDPATGLPVFARTGRYGPYVQLGETAQGGKPKTASLFPGMSLDTVTLEDALKLLSLPRVVGVDPTDGEEITAQMGRFGPYLKKGSETRSLEREQDLFTIGLEEALALFAQPKKRTRPGQPTAPLRELGTDPATGRPIVVRTGRYGPYVTDGEVNATIPKGEAPEEITLERAVELLA
ncbi:MAG: type I DNA topoisomerase, partial [Acidimicrobiia bacterium]